MNIRILGFLAILSLLSIIPIADAQFSIGEKAKQKSVDITISSSGEVHVKHVIGASSTSKQIELVYGTVSNLKVTNEEGEEKQFSVFGDNSGVLILPSNQESIVEYDLDDVLTENEGIWTWSFLYLETTNFIFPEEVDLIFTNEKPVYLEDKKGIACHGCQVVLEYSMNEPVIFKNVKWEDKEFVVSIRSHVNIENFIFSQPSKSITFDVTEANKVMTIIMPLELLWSPYTVLLDDEKIHFNNFKNNGTHVWLNIRPDTTGEISIIGTTVVPEFPIIAPLAMGFLIVIMIPIIRKINLH